MSDEYTSRELIAFMTMPVAQLANAYYLIVDRDPRRQSAKAKQLWQMIRRRKLTLADLADAWEAAKDEAICEP
jgi:hypothetical protein